MTRIYPDGAAEPTNPGYGGWAVLIVNGKETKQFSGGFQRSTNNRMEIMALLKALERCSDQEIEIVTDSQYLINSLKAWIHRWKKNGWLTKSKNPVMNRDLFEKVDSLLTNRKATFRWVKGHGSCEENNYADFLANEEARAKPSYIDEGYR